MKNKYTIDGEYVYIELQNGNMVSKISLCDFEKVNNFPNQWHTHYEKTKDNYYACSSLTINGRRKVIRMHRFIKDLEDPKVFIDHINHNGLDNTRENMNIVTNQENQQNQKKIKGYYWNKRTKKYVTRIKVNKKDKCLGSFNTEQEAKEAYIKAKLKYHKYYNKLVSNIA